MARFTLIAHVLFLVQLRSLAIAWKSLRFLIYFSPAYCAVRIGGYSDFLLNDFDGSIVRQFSGG